MELTAVIKKGEKQFIQKIKNSEIDIVEHTHKVIEEKIIKK